ncbi:hypothetical protein Tco_0231247 [Tanacetum coccineum]
MASSNLAMFDSRPFRNLAYFGICARASVNEMFRWSCLRFSRNFLCWASSFSLLNLWGKGSVVDFPPLVVTPLASHPTIWALLIALDSPYTSNSSSLSNGYSQKDKNEAKTGQNRAREWKEREKTKPKAYSS